MNNSPPPKPISRARQKAVASKQATSDNETHNHNQARPSKTAALIKEVKSTKQISDDEDDLDMDLSLAPLKVSVTKKVLSDDEDESIVPLRTARGRSTRLASNSKPKKPVYIDSDEEETGDEQNVSSMEDDFDESE